MLFPLQAIEQKKKWASLWSNDPLFDFTFDLFDERKEAFKKSLERTIKTHKIVKSNPDLMSTHMTGAMGSVSPDSIPLRCPLAACLILARLSLSGRAPASCWAAWRNRAPPPPATTTVVISLRLRWSHSCFVVRCQVSSWAP